MRDIDWMLPFAFCLFMLFMLLERVREFGIRFNKRLEGLVSSVHSSRLWRAVMTHVAGSASQYYTERRIEADIRDVRKCIDDWHVKHPHGVTNSVEGKELDELLLERAGTDMLLCSLKDKPFSEEIKSMIGEVQDWR